jgi:hypothetical protein
VTTSRTQDTRDSGSVVHDGRLTLDLRQRPSRADVGLTAGRTSRSYQRAGDDMLQVKVELPGGALTLPCFLVSFATDAADGATDTVATHQPKSFVLNRRFANSADARTAMLRDAEVLGLHSDEIDRAFPDLGTGAAVPQSRVLHGLVHDWLSLEITVNDIDNGGVQAIYDFSVDQFHNPAVDAVVHDGVFGIDLTRRPSRAALGFLPAYPTAVVRAPYGQTLRVDLRLPDGRVAMPVDSVTSTSSVDGGADPNGVGEPRATTLVRTLSVADARAQLQEDTAALGLDAQAVAAALDGSGTVHTTLIGRDTAVYAVKVNLSANLAEAGDFAASLRYTFTYR